MEQVPKPRRRLNVLTKAERRTRIFARLREGWAYDEIAREERVSAEHIAGEAIGRGELKAIAPLIKVIDRLDRHQQTVVAKYHYGPEERKRLFDKLNRLADNLRPSEPTAEAADGDENNSAELPA